MKIKLNIFFLSLLILYVHELNCQQWQKISPLPSKQWEEKYILQNYVSGRYDKNISSRSELVSFLLHGNSSSSSPSKNFYIKFPNYDKNHPLIVIEERQPVDYLRIESQVLEANQNWTILGPCNFQDVTIPISKLTALVQFPHQENNKIVFVPAILYHSTPPSQYQIYKATFIAGQAIESGYFKIFNGKKVIHEGYIGRQLGGARFDIRIPINKLPNSKTILTLEAGLTEEGFPNGPLIRFNFMHLPI